MIDLETFATFVRPRGRILEAILAETYAAHCQAYKDFVIFDGGAHIGFHTERMADLPGVAQVYAVEADPAMIKILQEKFESRLKNETRNLLSHLREKMGDLFQGGTRNIKLVEAALQNDPSRTSVAWKSCTSHPARSSIVSDNLAQNTTWAHVSDMEYRSEISVRATTIDTILSAETCALPFLKLDLEGADLLALQGASNTLKNKRPMVAFENSGHAPQVHGFTISEMADFFDQLGYQPMNFIGEPIGPKNWFGFYEAWAVPKEYEDWLAPRVVASIERHMSVA